jgi:uncharacterized RDD family membrane protein YckC
VSTVVECSICGKSFAEDQVVKMGENKVCEGCKPIFLQRLREGVPVTAPAMRYAGFWIRFLAKVIDGVVLSAVTFILSLGFFSIGSAAGATLVNFGGFIFGLVYTVFFLGAYGATPGKMALGLRVVRSDGSKITYGRGFGRYWAELVSSVILLIGYIIAAFDGEKRALHDRICDTRVIKA